jgi:hypothetical protein
MFAVIKPVLVKTDNMLITHDEGPKNHLPESGPCNWDGNCEYTVGFHYLSIRAVLPLFP